MVTPSFKTIGEALRQIYARHEAYGTYAQLCALLEKDRRRGRMDADEYHAAAQKLGLELLKRTAFEAAMFFGAKSVLERLTVADVQHAQERRGARR